MAVWLAALHGLEQAGTPAVLVTLLAARGSTPREAGCKMVVTADAAVGTIGGGNLEFQCIARARDMLHGDGGEPLLQDFPLGPALGQCCGGHARVLFEAVRPPSWRIALFGAGHVGRALVALLGTMACRVQWIDPREDAFPAALPANVVPRVVADPARVAAELPAGTHVLVMTHDHALDCEIVAAALPRPGLPFVGLIGSETKRARFVGRLARRGLDAEAIRRLTCPIGVPGAGGKAPAEIAIAVAAQLLQIRDAMAPVAPPPHPGRVAPDSACAGCGTAGCHVAEEAAER
ncbi:MAG TPA: xanthine dehydrogenase accessory protein XdhC [Acetobacteraceae bacterium]|nr:xanthine dehydrogenase accessory protein XdhC [Acetobacteraceae bacterium]